MDVGECNIQTLQLGLGVFLIVVIITGNNND